VQKLNINQLLGFVACIQLTTFAWGKQGIKSKKKQRQITALLG
jgi:hypothetical protein